MLIMAGCWANQCEESVGSIPVITISNIQKEKAVLFLAEAKPSMLMVRN